HLGGRLRSRFDRRLCHSNRSRAKNCLGSSGKTVAKRKRAPRSQAHAEFGRISTLHPGARLREPARYVSRHFVESRGAFRTSDQARSKLRRRFRWPLNGGKLAVPQLGPSTGPSRKSAS